MRTATASELAVLAATTRAETLRVKVANGSGTMIDLTSWVVAYSIDGDKDQPVGGATVSFARADGPTKSFSPLRTDSTLNRLDDGVTYGPQLDINRAITIELATTAPGAAILGSDYKLLFKGTIDIVDFASTPVKAVCRDLGAQIVDRKIEATASYGSGPGIAVETVMQSELDAIFGAGVIPLYTPSSPSYQISPAFQQQVMPEMDAQVALAQLPGFDVRYRWDDGTAAFRFTLTNPPRTKTTPDYTFGPSGYFDVTALSLDITDIRNVIIVNYPDSADFGNRHTITVSDSASITKYGRRTLIITEADTSPINTSAEATTMGNAALSDLKEPKADQEILMPLFWPGDLDDLYRFSPNGVHYNTNQDLAVVQITHSGQKTDKGFKHQTNVKVRGSPIGQYNTWLGRGGTIGPGGGPGGSAKPPTPFIVPLGTEVNDSTWDLQFYATTGTGGGGTNLTYTITLKKTFGAATTLSTGNASAFPLNLTVTRDVRYDAVLTFTVTDAGTGMVRMETYAIPSVTSNFLGSSGTSLTPGVTDSTGGAVNKAFHKPNSTDPDHIDSIPDGSTYSRPLATRISAGKPLIDFSEAIHVNKHLDNIGDGSTWKRVTAVNGSNQITPPSSVPRNRCKLHKSVNQSINHNSKTFLTWDVEDFDSNNLHDNVTSNTRITIPSGGNTGLWIFVAQINWAENATGLRYAYIKKNNSTYVANQVVAASHVNVGAVLNDGCIHTVTAFDDAPTAGDYYEVEVGQDSGAALNVVSYTNFMAIHTW